MGVNRIIGTPDEAWSFSLFAAAMTRVMRSDISLSVIGKWRLVISVWLLFPQFIYICSPIACKVQMYKSIEIL